MPQGAHPRCADLQGRMLRAAGVAWSAWRRTCLPPAPACRRQCFVTPSVDGEAISESGSGHAVPGGRAVERVLCIGAAAGWNVRPQGVSEETGRREAEASAGGSGTRNATAWWGEKIFEARRAGEAEPAPAREWTAKPAARGAGPDDGSGAAGACGAGRWRQPRGGGEGAAPRARPGDGVGPIAEEGAITAYLRAPATWRSATPPSVCPGTPRGGVEPSVMRRRRTAGAWSSIASARNARPR